MLLLAIDVGNTNITFAVFHDTEILADWRVSTDSRRTADEYGVILSTLAKRADIDLFSVNGVCISSVVPGAIEQLKRFAKRFTGADEPLVLTSSTVTGVKIRYTPQTDVGADRLANAAAAHQLYEGPVIVVDFGTATTLDAISADGEYLGGAIAPGIQISAEALFNQAAQLRRIEFIAPPSAIGTTTAESLQSGIIFGYAGQVDGLAERFLAEMGPETKVVATGGLAGLIAPHSRTIQEVDPLLTLVGLRIIHERYINRG